MKKFVLHVFSLGQLLVNASIDPCSFLCDEFSAESRGNGYDLCEGSLGSQCVADFCTNIFWHNTENGERGLVYIPPADSDSPLPDQVSCMEALAIGRPPDYDFHFHAGLVAFLNLQSVRQHLSNMTAATNSNSSRLFTYLNRFISSPPNPISYTLLRNIHDVVWPHLQPDLHDTYSVILALSRFTNTQSLMTWSMSRDMRCTGCGNLFVSRFNGAIEISVPSYRARTNGDDTYPIEELLENLFQRTISRRAFCPDCGRVDDTFTTTRINEFSNIMVLNIGGGGHPLVQEITIPFDLDMSRFAVGSGGGSSRSLLQYRLVAIIFAGEPATAFVRNVTNRNGWISVSEFSATNMTDFEDIHYESYISSNARTLVYERLDDI